ncbi:MAG: hypothetical protein LKF31_00030 [Muribaculaceae bacterium]|jgi:hypothetical protein|nr:hypothetical protein [Muribaculaceae bacterium]
MNKDSDILSKLGKDSGFKVPENYFSDFASKMAESLPEQEITAVPKPTMWHRVRTYVYMAAMFAGIWCMMKMFNNLSGSQNSTTREQNITAGFQNKDNVDDFMLQGDVSEYDILTYQDSVYAQDSASAADAPEEAVK